MASNNPFNVPDALLQLQRGILHVRGLLTTGRLLGVSHLSSEVCQQLIENCDNSCLESVMATLVRLADELWKSQNGINPDFMRDIYALIGQGQCLVQRLASKPPPRAVDHGDNSRTAVLYGSTPVVPVVGKEIRRHADNLSSKVHSLNLNPETDTLCITRAPTSSRRRTILSSSSSSSSTLSSPVRTSQSQRPLRAMPAPLIEFVDDGDQVTKGQGSRTFRAMPAPLIELGDVRVTKKRKDAADAAVKTEEKNIADMFAKLSVARKEVESLSSLTKSTPPSLYAKRVRAAHEALEQAKINVAKARSSLGDALQTQRRENEYHASASEMRGHKDDDDDDDDDDKDDSRRMD